MSPLVFWKTGGEGTLLSLEKGDRVELISTCSFAPGSRPEGTLSDHQRVWMKVHASRMQPDGRFLVSGRLLNATRTLRSVLELALAGPPHDSVPPRDSTPADGTPAARESSNLRDSSSSYVKDHSA
jgi:hypothetical protein